MGVLIMFATLNNTTELYLLRFECQLESNDYYFSDGPIKKGTGLSENRIITESRLFQNEIRPGWWSGQRPANMSTTRLPKSLIHSTPCFQFTPCLHSFVWNS